MKRKRVEITFLDHSSDDSVSLTANPKPTRTEIQLIGTIIGEDADYYLVEVVKCSLPGNAECWSVLKNTIIRNKKV
jgi:hypothetical protein